MIDDMARDYAMIEAMDGDLAVAAPMLVERLVKHGGNQVATAGALGVTDRTLRRWIVRLANKGHDVREQVAQELAKAEAVQLPLSRAD